MNILNMSSNLLPGCRRTLLIALSSCALSVCVIAQQPSNDPLPDIPSLMLEVEQHQRASEAIQKNYLYHEDARREDEHGRVTERQEYDVFWLNGVEIHKLTRKNGRDLTPEESRKEDERIDKEVGKAKERKRNADEKGQSTDSHGHEEVTVSRFLLLGRFTNPRREMINGRSTIIVDYVGDPKAATKNRLEDVIRNLAGTIWIDEQDRAIMRLEGHFVNNYKVGAGLFMNIKKDTTFSVTQKKINDEVWLPSEISGKGSARLLLFVNFTGAVHVADSEYRRFKTSATILPGVSTVDENRPGDGDTSTPAVAPPK